MKNIDDETLFKLVEEHLNKFYRERAPTESSTRVRVLHSQRTGIATSRER